MSLLSYLCSAIIFTFFFHKSKFKQINKYNATFMKLLYLGELTICILPFAFKIFALNKASFSYFFLDHSWMYVPKFKSLLLSNSCNEFLRDQRNRFQFVTVFNSELCHYKCVFVSSTNNKVSSLIIWEYTIWQTELVNDPSAGNRYYIVLDCSHFSA